MLIFLGLTDPFEVVSNSIHSAKKARDLVNKISDEKIIHAVNNISKILVTESRGSGITLTNSEIKVIIKVIRSLENRNFIESNY